MTILYVGRTNTVSENLINYLKNDYDIMSCDFVSDTIRRNVKIIKPDLVFVSYDETVNDMAYIKLIDDTEGYQLLILCNKDDKITQKYKSKNIHYMYRPVNLGNLTNVINEILGVSNDTAHHNTSNVDPLDKLIDSPMDNINKKLTENIELASENSNGKRNILAVDDNAQVLRSIKSMLKEDYNVSLATSVELALQKLDDPTSEYDLILLDYEMPEVDGLTALQLIKSDPNLSNIPVVFLTGVSDKQRIMKVIDYKPEAYLLKPIESEALRKAIEDLI